MRASEELELLVDEELLAASGASLACFESPALQGGGGRALVDVTLPSLAYHLIIVEFLESGVLSVENVSREFDDLLFEFIALEED